MELICWPQLSLGRLEGRGFWRLVGFCKLGNSGPCLLAKAVLEVLDGTSCNTLQGHVQLLTCQVSTHRPPFWMKVEGVFFQPFQRMEKNIPEFSIWHGKYPRIFKCFAYISYINPRSFQCFIYPKNCLAGYLCINWRWWLRYSVETQVPSQIRKWLPLVKCIHYLDIPFSYKWSFLVPLIGGR